MKLKVLIGILVVLIVMNLATLGSYVYYRWKEVPAWTGKRIPPFPPGRGPMNHSMRHPMNFTDEQLLEMRKLLTTYRNEIQGLEEELMKEEEHLLQLLQETPINHSEIEKTLSRISEVQLEIRKIGIQKLIKTKEFLSPEQQRHFYHRLFMGRFKNRPRRRLMTPMDTTGIPPKPPMGRPWY
ncbi:MAG: periplasmic heavy metal sensor [Calditrichaeota bacterium]|nr:MAG: periplasmic heavy metal sensor [Calditrichota bacterium]